MINTAKINHLFNYEEYKNLVIELSENKSCTGEISEEHIAATKINAQRMKRLDKQILLNNKIIQEVKNIRQEWLWIMLAESWCGDGAQNIPIVAKIAELSPNIELKLILRDENPIIMDTCLTKGARAIPKLICIEKETKKEIGTWGPRPQAIQAMVKEFKTKNPGVPHDEFVTNLHLWYANDKGQAIQNELALIIPKWNLFQEF